MKKILIGLAVGIFLISVMVGMISMVIGFFTGNSEISGIGIIMTLTSLFFLTAFRMALDTLDEYL